MSTFSLLHLRLFGIAGIVAALLFMAGDLLYNHIPGSKKSPTEKMSALPEARLLNAGTLGLVGCWLYLLASMHLYIAFQPMGETFALVLLFALAAVMIGYGIGHTAYFAIASGAQTAVKLGTDPQEGGRLGNIFFQRLTYITYLPVLVFSGMMLYGILSGRSLYPRWMAVFLPLVIYLLKTPVLWVLKGRLKELVNDCYDNLVLLIFYAISTLVLWNG